MTRRGVTLMGLGVGAALVVAAGLTWFARIAAAPAPAPAFRLVDRGGRVHRLRDYRGKILVLNFWAPWCAPCRRELPLLAATARRLGARGVRVLGVAEDTTPAELDTATVMRAVDYPIVLAGPSLRLQARYAESPDIAETLPLTVIVNRSGRIVSRLSGELSARRLSDALSPLLSSDSSEKPPRPGAEGTRTASHGAGP